MKTTIVHTDEHAEQFSGLDGVLLQSKAEPSGWSRHPAFARMQHRVRQSMFGRPIDRP